MVKVYETVRSAGIQKVAFMTGNQQTAGRAMKIRTPIPEKKSRLEIIPLIDIMFFLLASFMMISLQMQIVRTVKANLPTATLATASTKPDIVNLLVNRDGQVSVDKKADFICRTEHAADEPLQLEHESARLYHRRAGRHAWLGGVCSGFCETRRHPHVAIAVKAAPDQP